MSVPYKYRGCVLAALLFLLLPSLAMRFALSGTFAAWRDCRRLARSSARPLRTEPLADAMAQGPELIFSGGLLDSLRRTASLHAVRVAGYEPSETVVCEGAALHTARIVLTGRFTDLCRAVLTVERSLPHCRVRSLDWRAVAERRQREVKLTLTVEQIHFKP